LNNPQSEIYNLNKKDIFVKLMTAKSSNFIHTEVHSTFYLLLYSKQFVQDPKT